MVDGRPSAISRRDVIRRGAIVGGAVWAAPSVMKLSPAYGQEVSPQCACPAGTTQYRMQYTIPSTTRHNASLTDSCSGAGADPQCEPSCWDTNIACSATGIQSTNYQGASNRAGYQEATVTFKPGATILSDSSSCPRTANSGSACASGTEGAAGGRTTLTYSGCEAGEVINIVYCY